MKEYHAPEISTVNYHLIKQCNMRCNYCFATFLDIPTNGPLPVDSAVQLVHLLSEAGFRKLNFAGGEPTLYSGLNTLIKEAKAAGMVTSIVTNGSRITADWLDDTRGFLDMIALSIDSLDPAVQQRVGRVVGNRPPLTQEEYRTIAEMIKERGIRLKINTVVSRANYTEDLRDFILAVRPERWKVFQVLPVEGQNDGHIEEYTIDSHQFAEYVERNGTVVQEGIKVVSETNELMTGSYIMVDPLGRFFDDTRGRHTYSRPILQIGVETALQEIRCFPERFVARGGSYD